MMRHALLLVAALSVPAVFAQGEDAAPAPPNIDEILKEAPSPEEVQRLMEQHGDAPWKRYPIDARLLTDRAKAERHFEDVKGDHSVVLRRRRSPVHYAVTLFSGKVYNALVTALGASKGWDAERTKSFFTLYAKDTLDKYEFRVRIDNRQAPRFIYDVKDIHKRTYLRDDRGNTYRPTKWQGMGKERVTDAGEYTVWFRRFDLAKQDIVEKARKRLYLCIEDQGEKRRPTRIGLPKRIFQD